MYHITSHTLFTFFFLQKNVNNVTTYIFFVKKMLIKIIRQYNVCGVPDCTSYINQWGGVTDQGHR